MKAACAGAYGEVPFQKQTLGYIFNVSSTFSTSVKKKNETNFHIENELKDGKVSQVYIV